MTPTIRQYAENDLEDLLTSWEKATRLAHPFLEEDFLKSERHNIPNVYMPIADTWVADIDGKVVDLLR